MKSNIWNKMVLSGFICLSLFATTSSILAEETPLFELEGQLEQSALEEGSLPGDESQSNLENPEGTNLQQDALKVALEKAKEILTTEPLITKSKADLEAALEIAENKLLESDASDESIQDAIDNLEAVMEGLIYRGDTSELKLLVSKAERIDQSALTEESTKALKDAIMYARSYLPGEASVESVEDAYNNLQTVMENLDYLPQTDGVDTAELKKAVQAADKISVAHKTEYTKTRFLYALDNARAGLSNPDLSQSEVNALVTNLKLAQGNLESLPGVEEIIEEVPNDYVEPTEETEVLPSTGMGALGLMTSHSMIVAGLSMIVFDKKKQ